jgi:hypothetical protein
MRSRTLSQLLEWRWAPCAALVLGSLTFVALALLLIPDHLGAAPSPADDHGALIPVEAPVERDRTPARAQAFPIADTPRIPRPAPIAAPIAAPVATDAPPTADDPGSDGPATTVSDPSERHARRRLRLAGAPRTLVAEPQPSLFPDTPAQPSPAPAGTSPAPPDTPPPPPADTPTPTPAPAPPQDDPAAPN